MGNFGVNVGWGAGPWGKSPWGDPTTSQTAPPPAPASTAPPNVQVIANPAHPTPVIAPFNPQGRVLGLKLLPTGEDFEVDTAGLEGAGAIVDYYGYAPILSVENYFPKVQSTIFYGQNLYMPGHAVGVFDNQTRFKYFLSRYKNKKKVWAELAQVPISPYLRRIYVEPTIPQDPPVVEASIQLIDGGYDPLKGYWVEFLGNFFLSFPLFQPQQGFGQPFTANQPSIGTPAVSGVNGPNPTQGSVLGGAVFGGPLPGGKCE